MPQKQLLDDGQLLAQFVGHPLAEERWSAAEKDGRTVAVLPGSRVGEIEKILPVQLEAVDMLARSFGGLKVSIPAANGKAMRTIKRASELVVSEQMIMGIYPEGTRSKTGELLEFKEGAFLLAKRAKAPVVVITTKGTDKIAKRMVLKSTKVELDVI